MSSVEPYPNDASTDVALVLVTTKNGSRNRIDVERLPAVRYADPDMGPGNIRRRDGDELRLLAVQTLIVGRPMKLLLDLREDGVPTVRQTGFVTAIERLS